MKPRRLSWVVAVTLASIGSLAAHSLGLLHGAGEGSTRLGEHDEAAEQTTTTQNEATERATSSGNKEATEQGGGGHSEAAELGGSSDNPAAEHARAGEEVWGSAWRESA